MAARGRDASLGVTESPRRIGLFLFVVGLTLLPAFFAYANVRFPLTNYNSQVGLESPVAYYTHAIQAGDTILLVLSVTGGPADLLVLDDETFDGFVHSFKLPPGAEPVIFLPGIEGSLETRFTAGATGTYHVIFTSACASSCGPVSVRAQVFQVMGTIAGFPVVVSYIGALAATIIGAAILAFSPRTGGARID